MVSPKRLRRIRICCVTAFSLNTMTVGHLLKKGNGKSKRAKAIIEILRDVPGMVNGISIMVRS